MTTTRKNETIRRSLWLALAMVVLLPAAGCRGKYIRPVTDEKIKPTSESLLLGSYLVNTVMSCGACHTTRENGSILTEPERTDAYLGGGNIFEDKGFGKLWVPNITPDPETGIGSWTDDEIMRTIRDGVHKDGRFMIPMMPFGSYQHLSDSHLRAVVGFLRSVTPYKQPKPRQEHQLGFMPKVLFTMVGVQMHKPAVNVSDVDPKNTLAYGHYLARIASCTECHSLGEKGPREENDPLFMSGSDEPFEHPDLGKVYARNLTPDIETGIGKYDAAAIKQAIRNGTRLDGKRMAPPMAILIPHLSSMTDPDLDAIITYLKSVPAAKHQVPDRQLAPAAKKAAGE